LPAISPGFLAPAFAAIIYALALRPRWSLFLEARWLLKLGDASYSLYMLHSVVLVAVWAITPDLPGWPRVGVAFAATLITSLLAYSLVERPARNWLSPGKSAKRERLDYLAAPAAANIGP
jgi:peptidoglycan/LPS O-acetylase OafA/YrhL